MKPEAAPQKIWPLPFAIGAAIGLFAGTFYVYAEGIRLHQPMGLLPIGVGTLLFMVVMAILTDAALERQGKRRIGLTFGIVFGETIIFVYAIMFLILNIFGS